MMLCAGVIFCRHAALNREGLDHQACLGQCREHALWLHDPGAADSDAVCNEKRRDSLAHSVPSGAGGCDEFALTLSGRRAQEDAPSYDGRRCSRR